MVRREGQRLVRTAQGDENSGKGKHDDGWYDTKGSKIDHSQLPACSFQLPAFSRA